MKPGVVAHACNPSIWEAETRGSWFADSLSSLVRPLQLSETLFQIKIKMGWRCSSEVEGPWVPSPGTTKIGLGAA